MGYVILLNDCAANDATYLSLFNLVKETKIFDNETRINNLLGYISDRENVMFEKEKSLKTEIIHVKKGQKIFILHDPFH